MALHSTLRYLPTDTNSTTRLPPLSTLPAHCSTAICIGDTIFVNAPMFFRELDSPGRLTHVEWVSVQF